MQVNEAATQLRVAELGFWTEFHRSLHESVIRDPRPAIAWSLIAFYPSNSTLHAKLRDKDGGNYERRSGIEIRG